jgi:IS605 OrfB family transposase
MKKLREGKKKRDYRWKTASLIVRNALRTRGVIVVERISGDDIRVMIARYRNRQLRHRIYQSALKGELNTIVDKAKEYGVPVLMVDPRNTSKICPIHKTVIEYGEDRIGVCSKGGEKWHREVVALINIYLKALEALYEGIAQKGFGVPILDGSPVPLGSTATSEPIEIPRSLWGRWKSPMPQGCNNIPVDQEAKQSQNKRKSITIGGQAVSKLVMVLAAVIVIVAIASFLGGMEVGRSTVSQQLVTQVLTVTLPIRTTVTQIVTYQQPVVQTPAQIP